MVTARPRGEERTQGVRLVDVAALVGMSVGTAFDVLNRPDQVPAATREKVAAAMSEMDYVRGRPAGELAPHPPRYRGNLRVRYRGQYLHQRRLFVRR